MTLISIEIEYRASGVCRPLDFKRPTVRFVPLDDLYSWLKLPAETDAPDKFAR